MNNLQKAEKCRRECRYIESIKYFKRALKKEASVEIMMGLADVYRMIGKFKNAASLYDKCRKISKMIGDEQLYADSLTGFGMAKRGLGKYNEAYRYLNLANLLYAEFKDEEGEAFCKWCLAGLHRIKGDLKESQLYFIKALSLYISQRYHAV